VSQYLILPDCEMAEATSGEENLARQIVRCLNMGTQIHIWSDDVVDSSSSAPIVRVYGGYQRSTSYRINDIPEKERFWPSEVLRMLHLSTVARGNPDLQRS
jgi:hypothetical protein